MMMSSSCFHLGSCKISFYHQNKETDLNSEWGCYTTFELKTGKYSSGMKIISTCSDRIKSVNRITFIV